MIDALWRATWASGGRADNRIREAASSNYPRLEPRRREASERNRSRWRLVRNIHRSALTMCGARADAVWDQKLETFLRLHERAFRDLGGVPLVIRHDNLKAAVVRACFFDPDSHDVYLAFAAHWGFTPCRRTVARRKTENRCAAAGTSKITP